MDEASDLFGRNPRFFPIPSESLYCSGDNAVPLGPAACLLALASRDIPSRERGLDEIGRLLTFHSRAIAAEVANQWRGADFWWCRCIDQYARLKNRPQAWDAAAGMASDGQDHAELDGVALRLRVLSELLVDTHRAFGAGYAGREDKFEQRRFAHLDYAARLLDLEQLSLRIRRELLNNEEQARLEYHRERKQYKCCLNAAESLVRKFPRDIDYQDALAALQVFAAVDQLSGGESELANKRDARRLQRVLRRLDSLRSRFPKNSYIYDRMGALLYIRSVRLANSGQLADALVEVHKALAFDPSHEEARKGGVLLSEMMGQLQARAADLRKQMGPNSHLTAAGQKIMNEAGRGFGPLQAYAGSDKPKQVAAALQLAQAYRYWHRAGLPPAAARADERAVALRDALYAIAQRSPSKEADLSALWTGIAANHAELQDIQSDRVVGFLRCALFGEEILLPDGNQLFSTPQPIVTANKIPRQQAAPFLDWLGCRHDLGLKTLAAAASLLVSSVALLTWHEQAIERTRADAFANISNAQPLRDEDLVARESARFFGARFWLLRDAREADVRKMQVESAEWPAQRHLDEAYERLLQADGRGDARVAMLAAEDYLAALSPGSRDDREAAVREFYRRNFVSWFASLDREPDADDLRAIGNYANHVSLLSGTAKP